MGTTIDGSLGVKTAIESGGVREERTESTPEDRFDTGGERDRNLPLVKGGTAATGSAVDVMRRQQMLERERKVHDRLTRFARGYSRDWDVELVAGDRLAFDPERKRLSYPIERMMRQSDTQNLADLINALAPAKYSLIPPTSELTENPTFALLWKALDTMRVRNIASARHPNVTKMLRSRNEDLTETSSAGLKSKEFIDTLLKRWATAKEPEGVDPAVSEALARTKDAIDEATRVPPKVDLRYTDPDEATIRHEAERSFSIIRDHVWPAVEHLLREDLEEKNDSSNSNSNSPDTSSKAEGDTGKSDNDGKPAKEPPKPNEAQKKEQETEQDQQAEAKGEKGKGETQGNLPKDPLEAGQEGDAKEQAKKEIRDQMQKAAEKLDGAGAERAPIPDPKHEEGEKQPSGKEGGEEKAPAPQPGGTTPAGTGGKGKTTSGVGTSTAAPTEATAKRSWTDVKKQNHKVIHDMIVQFATHFMREGVPNLVGHFSEGEVWDMQKGLENKWRAQATGEKDDREYLQEEDPIETYDEVILVVDTSKSMEEGGKEDAATDALVAFHETFRTLGVRHAIVEFAGTPTVLLDMGKTPNPKEREQILGGLRLKETGTDDYSALLKAKTLFSNNATRKLIVFITDGKGSNLQRRAVELAEDHEGIRTLGMHIGGGENAVAESYRHSTSQSNVRLVPRAMSDFLLAHW